MALLITHFFEGGTEDQYRKVVAKAHPAEGLPAGQRYHAAGPTEGGWLIVAVWDSREAFDSFVHDTLVPVLQSTEGGFTAPPQERVAEVANLVTA
jgi:hypothetical protein